MLKRVVLTGLGLVTVFGVGAVAGFAVGWFDIGPANGFASRVERKLGEMRGMPTELERTVATVETTVLELRGEVHVPPNRNWRKGGGLVYWDDQIFAMTSLGRVLRFDEVSGALVETDLRLPDAGHAEYEALAEDPEWAAYVHKPYTQRYNDIELIDGPTGPGLAISYTFFDADRVCYGTRVATLALGEMTPQEARSAPEDWEVVFETAPCLELNPTWTALDGIMAGGRLAFAAPGMLYLGSGEYHLDGVHTYDVGIQQDDNDYGKVIAIDLATGESWHVSKGHRNMQGVAVDGLGRLFVSEHGVRGGDELNLIEQGDNYGWPLTTLGTLYSGSPWPYGAYGRHDEAFTPPVYAWLPSAAISSLAALDGFHPAWDGDLIAGSLSSAEFGASLWRIRVIDGRAQFVERIELGTRIRYVMQAGPDRLAVWSDSNELILFTVSERADRLSEALAVLKGEVPEDVFGNVAIQFESCSQCHAYEQGQQRVGPALAAIHGAEIASQTFGDYSQALTGVGGIWDDRALKAYLVDPQAFAEGTTMGRQGLSEGPVLDGVVRTLEILSSKSLEHLQYN